MTQFQEFHLLDLIKRRLFVEMPREFLFLPTLVNRCIMLEWLARAELEFELFIARREAKIEEEWRRFKLRRIGEAIARAA